MNSFLKLALVLGIAITSGAAASTSRQGLSESQDFSPAAEPQLLAPELVPQFGTFCMLSDFVHSSQPLPYPLNPFPDAPVYFLCEPEIFIVDDSAEHGSAFAVPVTVDQVIGNIQLLADTIHAALEASNELTSAIATGDSLEMGLDSEEAGGGIDNWSTPTNALYLSISAVSNDWVFVDIGNSSSGTTYELLSSEDVGAPFASWFSEGQVMGYEGTTPTMIPTSGRTNLFLCVRDIDLDSSERGIPDYWLLQHFGTINADPWADPDGDCWSNFDEFMRGTHPLAWTTPPAPAGLVVRYNAYTGDVAVNWQASPGTVTGYTVERWIHSVTNTFDLSAATTSLADWVPNTPTWQGVWGPTVRTKYRVKACYGAGDSAWAECPLEFALAPDDPYPPQMTLVAGPGGTAWLAARNLPADTAGIRITRIDFLANELYWDSSYDVSWDFACLASTNGFYQLPSEITSVVMPDGYGYSYYWWWVQAIGRNNELSAGAELGWGYRYLGRGNTDVLSWMVPPFRDGREALKQNLKFLLRAATMDFPFHCIVYHSDSQQWWIGNPTNYAFAGIHDTSDQWSTAELAVFKPFRDNYEYRNFVFSVSDLNEWGGPSTGVEYDWPTMVLYIPSTYEFHETGNSNIAAVLDPQSSRWLYVRYDPWMEQLGLITLLNPPYGVELVATNNLFGLSFLSANCVHVSGGNITTNLLLAGQSTSDEGVPYTETAQPQLRLLQYDFCRPGIDPLPGEPQFSTSSTNRLLIASVGDTFSVAGYAKLAVDNGYANVFAYLGQYFERASTMDSNGVVTTNSAGMLSEYGEFFPTVPGPAALITMPDLDTGQRGTGVVHVIKLQVDANHDGVMDPTFGGPDDVSTMRPFRFWINDDADSGDTGGSDIPQGNMNGKANGRDDHVNGVRDLVDFFPVYLNVRSSMQAVSPYAMSLSCRLKQEDSALRYMDPLDYMDANLTPTNCLTYLTDTNIARILGRTTLPSSRTYPITCDGVLLDNQFAQCIRDDGKGILLIEAVTNTTRPLVLELLQGTNVLARAEVPLSITGVEQMFGHKNLMPAQTATNLHGPPDRLTDSDVPNEPETNGKNLVFLHGYNVNPNQARGSFAETFKRMYWSGSRAKFYGVSWFGSDSQEVTHGLVATDYHINVHHAFDTAPDLADFLGTLTNGPTTVLAHSLGNMVTLSALNDWNAPISNYFMLDAAVAIEAIDGGAIPIAHMTHSTWVEPENYASRLYASYWRTLFPTNDGRSTLTWSNRLGNFRNTQVYNFYSTGEEVLREYNEDPPTSLFGSEMMLVNYWEVHPPMASHLWVWQEKGKGVSSLDTVIGSTHGGWKFNTNAPYMVNNWHMPNSQASLLPASELQTNAFFDMNYDYALFGPLTGSTYAQLNGNRILSDTIPALTWAVGSHPVPRLQAAGRNFNMNELYKNGWPLSRANLGAEADKWWHSDFKAVAYLYVYPLFNEFVTLGNLK